MQDWNWKWRWGWSARTKVNMIPRLDVMSNHSILVWPPELLILPWKTWIGCNFIAFFCSFVDNYYDPFQPLVDFSENICTYECWLLNIFDTAMSTRLFPFSHFLLPARLTPSWSVRSLIISGSSRRSDQSGIWIGPSVCSVQKFKKQIIE